MLVFLMDKVLVEKALVKKVLIIGAGWYGCYLAKLLSMYNIRYKILETANEIFTGSSSRNQNRLHLGFHYPKSDSTIQECVEGYERFHQEFAEMIIPNPDNNYYIHRNSKVNSADFLAKYVDFGIPFTQISTPAYINSDTLSSAIQVDEKVVDYLRAREYFTKAIPAGAIVFAYAPHKLHLTADSVKYDGEEYDLLMDCSYGQSPYAQQIFANDHSYQLVYEMCLSLVYEKKKDTEISITVMDGPFYSLYPYPNDENRKLYTLTDVEFSPFYSEYTAPNDALVESFQTIDHTDRINQMESKILKDYPGFLQDFQRVDSFISRKTKFQNTTDDRSVIYATHGKSIAIVGGKITGIFKLEGIIKKLGII